jgi:hypothetical protein
LQIVAIAFPEMGGLKVAEAPLTLILERVAIAFPEMGEVNVLVKG